MGRDAKITLSATQWSVALALLFIFAAQALTAIPALSLTADEPVYLAAGYAALRTGDWRMATQAQHPPLMQLLSALPLLLQPGPDLNALDGWATAEMSRFAPAFVSWYGDRLAPMTFTARLPTIGVGLLWAAFLFRWAADRFGPWGGLLALTLFVFDPNILAHTTLATTDVGFAAFSFAALFGAVRLLRHPSPHYLILTGLALGASLSAKSIGFFTALALVVLLPLDALLRGTDRLRRLLHALGYLAIILSLSLLVLWATWGFELRPTPLTTQRQIWREMQTHLSTGHTGYLMGQIRTTGWRLYYPIAFLLKTPPLTLALTLGGLLTAIVVSARHPRTWLPVWIYGGGYTAAAILSQVATGYRFLLPILPLCFLLSSRLFCCRFVGQITPIVRPVISILLAAHIAVIVHLHPHYLTYFNALAGGPTGGHRYLVDSNLDWGQSFLALRAFLETEDIPIIHLSYYTYTDPALYDIPYQPLPPARGAPPTLPARFDPPPGVYVIGATTLQGVMVVEPDMYDWFRHRDPIARPGNALFVYRVTPHPRPPAWLAQCTSPVTPLSEQAIQDGFGPHTNLRRISFDCTAGWVYPEGGISPGWYALHREIITQDSSFIQERLDAERLSYEQRNAAALPPFAIYAHSHPTATRAFAPTTPITPPLSTETGHLTFLGYDINSPAPAHPGQSVEVVTWWQVAQRPTRPLSFMLHMVGPGGAPVIVGDGLAIPIEQWHVGDVLLQWHRLAILQDAPPGEYTLVTGVYWLETLERWGVVQTDGHVDNKIVLQSIPIRP